MTVHLRYKKVGFIGKSLPPWLAIKALESERHPALILTVTCFCCGALFAATCLACDLIHHTELSRTVVSTILKAPRICIIPLLSERSNWCS